MIHSHHAMLSPVLQTVKATEAYSPNGDHTMFQRMFASETKSALAEVLDQLETPSEDKEKYNSTLALVSEALNLFLREAENPDWIAMTLAQRVKKVKEIKETPQIPQRSEEWYRNFGKVLTASEFSALFSNNKRRRDLVHSKASPPMEFSASFRHACPTEEMSALGWGIRFEPVVKQLIEYRDKCSIYEPGRLNHKKNTHLAASPDGVIESSSNPKQVGRLVEIKCPYSRRIGTEIPSDYWIQMQIQMEVADVDECEYIEVELVSKKAKQESLPDLTGTTYQGFVYLLKQKVEEDDPFEYKYIYGEIGSQEVPPIPDGYECIETIPWGLKSWHRKIVSRDRVWYESTKPWQEEFWREVETVRNGEELAPLPSTKPSKQDVCLID